MFWSSRATREQGYRHEQTGQHMVSVLLDAGAQLNAVDNRGASALSHAAAGGFEAIATKLVHAGADVNLLSENGSSIRIYIVVSQNSTHTFYSVDRFKIT
jgi:ankyrin repeat protein